MDAFLGVTLLALTKVLLNPELVVLVRECITQIPLGLPLVDCEERHVVLLAMIEPMQPLDELEKLKAENKKLKEENEKLRKENKAFRKHLLGVMSQIDIGQPVASNGTPLRKVKAINEAEAFLEELGLRLRP